jgi:hypothetical protein
LLQAYNVPDLVHCSQKKEKKEASHSC